jgi:hypothetical protein
MAFKQWSMGTPHIPLVDEYYMRHILSLVGQQVIHRSKRDATKCSCWSSTYGHPDRTCTLCDGSGYLLTDRLMKGYIEQYPPLGRQGIGDFVTQAGMVQRYTHRIFTYGWEHEKVALHDIIVFPIDSNLTRFEHDVILNEVKWGSYGQRVFTEIRMVRKSYSESGETNPTKPMA